MSKAPTQGDFKSMLHKLLIEIGCEELPAWAVRLTLDQLGQEIPQSMTAWGLSYSNLRLLGTPRRIVVMMDELPERQHDRSELVTGPPLRAAYDKNQQPTKAALGFAAKCGVGVDDLHVATTAKGEYLCLKRVITGRPTGDLIGKALPSILGRIPFKKPMYWSEDRFVFIRRIRWIVALLGGKPLSLRVADVLSSDKTEGHRLLGERHLEVHSPREYEEILRSQYVVLDPRVRKEIIARQLAEEAESLGGRLHADPELLEEVTFLNEYPQVIHGSIRKTFLALPFEVLTTVMRKHQKYFCVVDQAERLLPQFLAVIDMDGDPTGLIRRGHERVLEARLNDAEFFWNVDRTKSLESRLPSLGQYQFHVKLGSYLEKTHRIETLAEKLCGLLGRSEILADVKQAGHLAKADLTTEMVKELPELQGMMGGLYARREGLPPAVVDAIYDHYRPRNLDEDCPKTLEGALVSLADSADTLAGCFGIGMSPKGSSDPFALRRHAQGVIKILWDHRLPFSIDRILELAFQEVSGKITLPLSEAKRELIKFFERRLRYMLQHRGFSYDVINAVLAGNSDDPVRILDRAAAVQKIRPEPDFEAIAAAVKRVENILGGSHRPEALTVDEHLLEEGPELELYEAFERLIPAMERSLSESKFYDVLKGVATLRPFVDRFFDEVLVMSPVSNLRNNRLALLARMSRHFHRIADLSEIVVEGKTSTDS